MGEKLFELVRFTPFDFSGFFMINEGNLSSSKFFNMTELTPILQVPDAQPSADNRILIFTPEVDTSILLKTLLELWGFQTEISDSLEKSLLIIENWKPNLILLDSVLPFDKHLENLRQIRGCRFSKELPIIVISGFSQPRFRSLSKESGANDFFVKPIDFDLLESCLKKKFAGNWKLTH